MSEYNRRQVDLLLSFLHAYEAGGISLSFLVSRVEALIDVIEFSGKEELRREFLRHWAVLEHIYAHALDKNVSELSIDYKLKIDRAVIELRNLASNLAT